MTPEQIDAVLPRVPAGVPALTGDLTDDEERAVAVRWLLEFYREATRPDGGPWITPPGEVVDVMWEHQRPMCVFCGFNVDPLSGGRYSVFTGQWKHRGCPDSPPGAPESDETTSEVPGVRGNDSGETTALSDPVLEHARQMAAEDPASMYDPGPWPPPYGPAPGITYWEAK